MSKHPRPWTLDHSGGIFYVFDADGRCVCSTTADPETRAVLLHAAEMWKHLRDFAECEGDVPSANRLVDKIEAEIAAAKGKS